MRLSRFLAAQDLAHDAAEELGSISMKGLSHALALQLSAVLDILDRMELLLDEALEMGV